MARFSKTRCLRALLAGCLYAFAALSAAFLLFHIVTDTTKWGRENMWEKWMESFSIRSQIVKTRVGDNMPIVYDRIASGVVYYWCVPLAIVLSAITVLSIQERRIIASALHPAKNILCWEIPSPFTVHQGGRRVGVLEWWCGGVTIGEVLLIIAWAGINVSKIYSVSKFRFQETDNNRISGIGLDEPLWATRYFDVGFALGVATYFNFMWVFYPISRHSPMFDMFGLSFEKRIRYHRWLSHFALTLVTVHGLGFWLLWIIRKEWEEQALDWGNQINYLAGAISYGFGATMWITATSYFRRNFFEIFYRVHIIGFVGFLVFANIHVPGFYMFSAGGLLTYVVDVVLRVVQLSTPVRIKSLRTNKDKSIAIIEMETPKGLQPNDVSTLWIQSRKLSLVQWHPATPVSSKNGKLVLCLKAYGNWTKGLGNEAWSIPTLKVEGPHNLYYNGGFEELMGYEHLLFCAGGIAITPVLATLQYLVREMGLHDYGDEREDDMDGREDSGANNTAPAGPKSILLIWAVRRTSELEVVDKKLLDIAMRTGRLNIQVYVTREEPLTVSMGENAENGTVTSPQKSEPGSHRAAPSRWHSPVLIPSHLGPIHLGFLYIVSYGGGLMGLILANAWRLEEDKVPGKFLELWKGNLMAFAGTFLMAIGLVTWLVLPAHMLMVRAARRLNSGNYNTLGFDQSASKDLDLAQEDDRMSSWGPEMMQFGRPDFDKILTSLKLQLSPDARVGVFGGGPLPMVQAVKDGCVKANRSYGICNWLMSKPFEFHQASFEL